MDKLDTKFEEIMKLLSKLWNLWVNQEIVKKPGKRSQVKRLNKLGFGLQGA